MNSLLERLTNDYEKIHRRSNHQQKSRIYQNLCHDLENLLNTRRRCLSFPDTLTELYTSLVSYGIPDFMGINLESESAQQDFCEELTVIIKRYEPRFKEVYVTLQKPDCRQDSRTLQIQIEGLLHAEPLPQFVLMKSILEPETRQFTIMEQF